jgi:hypothetical protein
MSDVVPFVLLLLRRLNSLVRRERRDRGAIVPAMGDAILKE